jgi:crotonobetainyl-CoA:carnitine CoA-transferase CaiB-like acyl-CoA transferase
VTGEPDGPPTSVGLPVCDLGTGMWAVQGILAALYERQRTGKAASASARRRSKICAASECCNLVVLLK